MSNPSGFKEREPGVEQTLPTEERGSQRVSSMRRLGRFLKDLIPPAGVTIPLILGIPLGLATEIFLTKQFNDVPSLAKTWVLGAGIAATLVPLGIKESLKTLFGDNPNDRPQE